MSGTENSFPAGEPLNAQIREREQLLADFTLTFERLRYLERESRTAVRRGSKVAKENLTQIYSLYSQWSSAVELLLTDQFRLGGRRGAAAFYGGALRESLEEANNLLERWSVSSAGADCLEKLFREEASP